MDIETPLTSQLRCLPLGHVAAPEFTAVRPAAWLRGAAAAGKALPLFLARDIGLLLIKPLSQLRLRKPDWLPFDLDTSRYLNFLNRISKAPLVREFPYWKPPLTEAVLSVVLARLMEGLNLPGEYRAPTGPAGVFFTRILANEMDRISPGRLWKDMQAISRPDLNRLATPDALATIESNLAALHPGELRFLIRYGPPMIGSPDPRDLLDMLALTGLPAQARLALSQTIKLLPRIAGAQTPGGVQTYPEGGYEGLSHKGCLDNLLRTELAFSEDILLHRISNNEALYYGRERPRAKRRELAYIVVQTGFGLLGEGEVMSKALLLALSQAMQRRGYEVLYSFAGSELTEPKPLDKPGEVGRILYHRETVRVNEEKVLRGVFRHLKGWRDVYRGRQVLWVLGAHFDADWCEDHQALYDSLWSEGGRQAWFIRVGKADGGEKTPVAAKYFKNWKVVETGMMWEDPVN